VSCTVSVTCKLAATRFSISSPLSLVGSSISALPGQRRKLALQDGLLESVYMAGADYQ
jgi:hypothetical protein